MINSPVEEIKNRLDVAEVVGSYVKLQKAGANYRAPCPFHSEKKPSFFVSPARQIWHCFGCSLGGDIFKFVMQIEGVEFGDALRILAQRAGVELKKPSREFVQYQTERGRLLEICELATRFFEKQLAESSAGKEAKSYLLGRGISEESIKKWRLGYSPDTWEGLNNFLTSQGYKKEEIVKAGLAVEKDSRDSYDRFRGRIIFPIFDSNSQVAGFTGRVFKQKDQQETAKYVNTPATILYDKSRILYGLDKAKVEIRRQSSCILVEGNTDAIMAHQAGTLNCVATSGTALTPFHLKILKRYTENLILGFDMDVAGETATKRGIDLAQSQGFNIKVLRLQEGKDAAEMIAKNPEEWLASLKDLRGIADFYFEAAFLNRDPNNPEAKKEISKIILPALKRIPNQIERSFWVQKLAAKLRVKESDILEELKKVKLAENYFSAEADFVLPEVSNKSRRELLQERLLILLIKFPPKINLVKDELSASLSEPCREIILKLKNNSPPESGQNELFNRLSLAAEVEEIGEKEIEPEIMFCLKEIQSLNIKGKLDEISRDIKYTEEEKNDAKTKDLVQRFSDTASQLTNL